MRRVLVVDDEESLRHMLQLLLRREGYEAISASSVDGALAELGARPYDIMITDLRMPGRNGLDLVDEVRARGLDTTVVVMTAYGSRDVAIEAMKRGAYDYLSKPFEADELILLLRKAEERERLARENRVLQQQLRATAPEADAGLAGMVAQSAGMVEIMRLVRKIAEFKTTVLVGGESGTGKELVARAIHRLSPRARAPFIAVNCGAIPAQLLESELFGHRKGAFTDAVRDRKGLFEEASSGTLFLDEIGELPWPLQVKLLRVLQEGEIRRLGDSADVKVDVRVVAATARDLAAEVERGAFREDLFYRLNVLSLVLPPLRDRRDDIPLLVAHFIERTNARTGLRIQGMKPEALRILMAAPWPGNVRELENTVERAMVLSEAPLLGTETLPEGLRRPPASPAVPFVDDEDLSIKRMARRAEETLIRRALARTGGNRTRAADLLEISHRALLYKIKEYQIGLRQDDATAKADPPRTTRMGEPRGEAPSERASTGVLPGADPAPPPGVKGRN